MKLAKVFLFVLLSLQVIAQKKYPVINNFGGVYDIPEAETIIDTSTNYKILVDITEAEKKSETEMNKAYELVARLYNLYALAGVKSDKLDVVIIIHYDASPTILSDESHQFAFKTKNPNTEVINTLAEAGAKIYVCGQSLRSRKLVEYKKNKHIKVVHGAILAITHFQSKGYSLLKIH